MLEFQKFVLNLKSILNSPLPGKDAQWKKVPVTRLAYNDDPSSYEDVKTGSVMILLYPEHGEVMTVFIKRAEYDGVHSGQISLPGGKYEHFDQSFENTAIRETEEEIGVEGADIRIIGALSDLYIPPSNFLVKTFIGCINYVPDFKPDHAEVDSVLTIRIEELFNMENSAIKTVRANNQNIEVPCYLIQNDVIWGATAMIISELEVLYKKIQK